MGVTIPAFFGMECFYDSPPPMPAMVSKPIARHFSPTLFFFAGPTCSCGSYCKFKAITHFFFSVWPPVTVNIINFLLHAIDGLGGGYRRNTL